MYLHGVINWCVIVVYYAVLVLLLCILRLATAIYTCYCHMLEFIQIHYRLLRFLLLLLLLL